MSNPEVENLFIETAGEIAESFSINRVVGQLYALLYFSPEPVSLDDMAKKLKISKGSASVNIRILESWKAVKKIWVQGSRKDFYSAEEDLFKIITERVQQGLLRRLEMAKGKKNQLMSLLETKNGRKETIFYKNRLKKLEELENVVESALKLLPKIAKMY